MLFYAGFSDFKVEITKEDIDILTPIQTHSNNVVFIKDVKKDIQADGIITDKIGLKIGIKTADCVPVLLKSKSFVGAVHAGWRGLYGGILKNAFLLFESFGELPYFGFVGPCAKDCCYEVGFEFKDYFKSLKTKDSRLFFDTQKEAIYQIKSLNPGIELLIYDTCSICNKNIPSYRRDKTKERMITFIERTS